MRRWLVRSALACLLVASLPIGSAGVRAFNRACDGSLEGLRYLASVRAQLASATAPPPTPAPVAATPTRLPATPTPTGSATAAAQPTPTVQPTPPVQPTPTPTPTPTGPTAARRALEAAGIAGDAVLVALTRVKQSDAVAYPAHVVAAHGLDGAGCRTDAVRLQWLKAGLHASGAGQPEQIAAALRADARDAEDLADLRRVVRTWTERAPENAPLRQVLAALDAGGQ